MTDRTNWAEADLSALHVRFGERPHMPAMPGATEDHRRQGRKLAAIHRAHLMDMSRIARLLAAIKGGSEAPAALVQAVQASDMAQNLRQFGALCGWECQVLNFHHDAEEAGMFPELEAKGSDALRAVVARLRAEHEVVHELIKRLSRAAMALQFEPGEAGFDDARAVFEQLLEVVQSHFHYEETELEEAIGVHLTGL